MGGFPSLKPLNASEQQPCSQNRTRWNGLLLVTLASRMVEAWWNVPCGDARQTPICQCMCTHLHLCVVMINYIYMYVSIYISLFDWYLLNYIYASCLCVWMNHMNTHGHWVPLNSVRVKIVAVTSGNGLQRPRHLKNGVHRRSHEAIAMSMSIESLHGLLRLWGNSQTESDKNWQTLAVLQEINGGQVQSSVILGQMIQMVISNFEFAQNDLPPLFVLLVHVGDGQSSPWSIGPFPVKIDDSGRSWTICPKSCNSSSPECTQNHPNMKVHAVGTVTPSNGTLKKRRTVLATASTQNMCRYRYSTELVRESNLQPEKTRSKKSSKRDANEARTLLVASASK